MKLSDIMGEAGYVGWAEAGLIVSLLFFLAIVFYTFRRGSRERFDAARYMPLEDDQPSVRDGETGHEEKA